MTVHSICASDPARSAPHVLHREARIWPESNCYVDLWIELLHALGHDPLPSLAFTVAMDFEIDQFTFFKPPHADLERLYGLEVQELDVWRPLLDHLVTQLAQGRLVLLEVDAFYLPDTAGTDYRKRHTKTTIGVERIDQERRRLGYFHNAGYFTLADEDFEGVLRVSSANAAEALPPYAEIVKLDRLRTRPDDEMRAIGRRLLTHHLRRRPLRDPFKTFARHLREDMNWLGAGDIDAYHRYAFANLRQAGSCFELAARFLRHVVDADAGEAPGAPGAAAEAFEGIAHGAQVLMLKLARFARSGHPFDPTPQLSELSQCWQRGFERLMPLLNGEGLVVEYGG